MFVSRKTLTIMLLATLAFTTVHAEEQKKDEPKKEEPNKDAPKKVKTLTLVDPFKEVKKDATSIQAALKKDWAGLSLDKIAAVGTENKDVCKEITLEQLKALSEDQRIAFAAGEGCKDTFMPKEVPAAKKDLCALYKTADDKVHKKEDIEKHVGAASKEVKQDFYCPAFKTPLPGFKEKGEEHYKAVKCSGNMVAMAATMLAVPAALAMMFI